MRIKIELLCEKNIILPKSYNAYLQGFVYTMLEPHAASWLHNNGFQYKEKQFRLFTFSEILQRAKNLKNNFIFPPQISFYVSSPIDWILEQVAHNAIKSAAFMLGKNKVDISSIAIMANTAIKNEEITIKAITPIEVHTTFETKDKKKKTHFFTPFENEFNLRIEENLQKKWSALYNRECPFSMQIVPMFKGSQFKRVRGYVKDKEKPFFINGWVGKYLLKGDPEFLGFALDTGLGSGNSRGFGMFEVV